MHYLIVITEKYLQHVSPVNLQEENVRFRLVVILKNLPYPSHHR